MAAGCVLWIYGRALPRIPFGSIWGIRTAKTLASETAWTNAHLKGRALFCILSLISFVAGILLLL
ncbi:MAG: SdpI family protein [Clostridia bacterium]|nr:SdpI family protein [Clostridia bacterium]